MTLRSGHGKGRGSPRVEVAPADEQPFGSPALAAPLVDRDDAGRVRSREAAARLARMPRRGAFLPRSIACDPAFEVHNRRRLEWTRKRRDELHAATGGVSHAVGAMIVAAGWAYAGGEFAAEQAAATGDVDLFKSAVTLTAAGRQHDLAAWELATREALARPKSDDVDRAQRMLRGDDP